MPSPQMPNSPPLTISSRRASAPIHDRFTQLQKESRQIPLPPSPQSLSQGSIHPPPPPRSTNRPAASRPRFQHSIIPLQPTRSPHPFNPFPQPLPGDLIDRRKTPDRKWTAPNVSWSTYRSMSPFDDVSIVSSRPFSPVSSIELSPGAVQRRSRSSPVDRQVQVDPFEPEPRRTISPATLDSIRPLSPLLGGDDWSVWSLGRVEDTPLRQFFIDTPAAAHHNTPISPRSSHHNPRESALYNDSIDIRQSILSADSPDDHLQIEVARVARSYSARTIELSNAYADMAPLTRFPPQISNSPSRHSRFTEHMNISGQKVYASTVDLVGSRSSLVLVVGEFGDEDGSEEEGNGSEGRVERNDSGNGSEGKKSRDENMELEMEVNGDAKKKEKRKKGWNRSLRKSAKWVFCCAKERPDEDTEG